MPNYELPMDINYILVNANNFIAVGYEEKNRILFIKLTMISKKLFYNVPKDIYEGLLSSDEKDLFFEENIKSKYRSV